MASFTQDPNPTNDPNYLGMSQGTDRAKADTSLGDLFQNIANVGGAAVKATYGIETQLIEEGLQQKIDTVRNEAGVDAAVDVANSGEAPTDVMGESGGLFEANTKAGRGSPAGVARMGSKIQGLNDAYRQGRLSDSYYNARLLAIVKEAKAQHPGFKDEIDSYVQRSTGINPANALVRSLRNDMDSMERARSAGATKVETEMRADAPFVPEVYQKRWAAGDRSPEFVADFHLKAAQFKGNVNVVQAANQRLELREKAGKATAEEHAQNATLNVDTYMTHKLSEGFMNEGGGDSIGDIIERHGDKPWSPEEQQQLTTKFTLYRSKTLDGVSQILSDPRYVKLPQTERDKIYAAAVKRLDDAQKMITDKDIGVIKQTARFNEARLDADTKRLQDENQLVRKMGVVSKIAGAAGPQVIGRYFLNDKGAKALDNSVKSLLDMDLTDASSGEGGIKESAERQKRFAATRPEANDPVAHKARVDIATQTLVQTKSPEEAANVAKYLFDPKNVGFLDLYKKSSQQRIFRALASPAVDLKMQEVRKTDPKAYENYRDMVVSYGFQSQVKRAIDTINEVHTDQNAYADVKLNPDGKFEVVPKPGYETERPFGMGVRRGDVTGNNVLKDIRAAVAEVNENIGIITPIIKRDGGDPVLEIGKVLKANGWDENAVKKPTFAQSLGNAIAGAFRKATGSENDAPKDLVPQESDYQLDNLPKGKGKAFRTDTGPQSDAGKIDLDAGTLQDVAAKSVGLKKQIRTAESSGDYDQVFGTSRKIPATKMTLDEIDSLQSRMKAAGSPSTAIGGYQFLQGTLRGLRKELGLKGDEIFDSKLQDKLADALLVRRGYGEYLKGKIGHKELVNKLAMEWAGLPNTSGQSHYEGDGLNHATVKLRPILDELKKYRVTENDQ